VLSKHHVFTIGPGSVERQMHHLIHLANSMQRTCWCRLSADEHNATLVTERCDRLQSSISTVQEQIMKCSRSTEEMKVQFMLLRTSLLRLSCVVSRAGGLTADLNAGHTSKGVQQQP
jgi:hypothetical protein